ncbi:MAG: LrgB family protein [Oscillospiraceae bacterium]
MICNGLVLATIMVIIVLTVFHIPYEAYYAGGSVINLFLSPATVCLAVSIYNKKDILKKNLLPVLAGCTAGSVASVLSVALGCGLFGLDRALTASLLPKSVTTLSPRLWLKAMAGSFPSLPQRSYLPAWWET